MAKGNRAATQVDLIFHHAKPIQACQHLRGEGLVKFDNIDIGNGCPAPGPRHHHAKRPAPLDNLRLNIRKRGKMAQLQTGQPVPIIGELR